MFIKHFASKNQLPIFCISWTLVENELKFVKTAQKQAKVTSSSRWYRFRGRHWSLPNRSAFEVPSKFFTEYLGLSSEKCNVVVLMCWRMFFFFFDYSTLTLNLNLNVHVDTGRKLNVHKTSWTSSERLKYVQFTSCVYGVELQIVRLTTQLLICMSS